MYFKIITILILTFSTFFLSAASSYSINEVLDSVTSNYALSINEAMSLIAPKESIDHIQFKPLLGGGTKAKIFRFDIGDKKYVLRLLDENQPIERRKSELDAHRIGAELQIAPEIIYADGTSLIMVMEFIEGRSLTREDLDNAEIVKNMICALKKFHEYSGEEHLVRRTKVQAIHDLYDRYKNKKGVVFPSCFYQLHSKLQTDFANLKKERVLSHGDFNPRNILVTENKRIYVIDWSQASLDHPFLDIGWLASLTAANHEQLTGLLKEYLGREPKESELQEALFFKDVTTFLIATLWIGRQEERDQGKLDAILEGSLKKGSTYIREGISIDDVLQEKGRGLTLYSLGWLKEFIDNQVFANQEGFSDMNKVIFIIGASGAGKTTAVQRLEEEGVEGVIMLYFDSIGVPSPEEMGDPETWQREATIKWVQRIKEEYLPTTHVLFDGQTRPNFIEEACAKNGISSYKVILVDCTDHERIRRLIGRGDASLANKTMIQWAHYLRRECEKRNWCILDNSLLDVNGSADALRKMIDP